ncbi:MAG: twin-arginine translocation signal domain-containing protein [Actinobacteria bacterium]|nr:twin-arginine translocation signal domain-containing protein [Actinomycetota bacterium]
MTTRRQPTRRQFLAAAAAAVAAPYFVPAKAFGPNDRINVGYIGCGRRAARAKQVEELRDQPTSHCTRSS